MPTVYYRDVYRDAFGRWRWRVISKNGRVVVESRLESRFRTIAEARLDYERTRAAMSTALARKRTGE